MILNLLMAAQAAAAVPPTKPATPPPLTGIVLIAPSEGAPPPAPPAPRNRKGAQSASGNLLSLFSTDDYPVEAMEKGEQGKVTVRLSISAQGKVTACDVTASSGSASLDAGTCQILMTRAKFLPAQDASGRKIPDTHVQNVIWRLPDPVMPFVANMTKTTLTFSDSGKLALCKSEPAIPSQYEKSNCDSMLQMINGRFGEGTIINRRVVFENGMKLGGADTLRGVGEGAGQTLIHRTGIALTVEADGSISKCEVTEGNTEFPEFAEEACTRMRSMPFTPLDPAAKDKGQRHGLSYFATYFEAPKP